MTTKCKITRHQQYATSIAKQRLTFALQLLKLQALLVKFCWCPLDIFGRALTWEINLHQLYYNILSRNQCKLEVSNTCKSFNIVSIKLTCHGSNIATKKITDHMAITTTLVKGFLTTMLCRSRRKLDFIQNGKCGEAFTYKTVQVLRIPSPIFSRIVIKPNLPHKNRNS